MVYTVENCSIPMSKWESVFNLLLFRQLRDDVDDTLVQKLISCIEVIDIENRGHAERIWHDARLQEQIPRALDPGGQPASVVFALRATGTFIQNEDLFHDVEGTDILHKLLQLETSEFMQDPSVKAAWLHTMYCILSHNRGSKWIMEHGIFGRVFPHLQDGSIFVQNAAQKFLSRFFCIHILDHPKSREVSTLVSSVCHPRDINQMKRCLHIIKDLMDDGLPVADILCTYQALDIRLKGLLDESEADGENDLCLGELLCRVLCSREDWEKLIITVRDLENRGKTATLIRMAAIVLQYPQTMSPELEHACFRTLGCIVTRHAKPLFVLSALCALRDSIPLNCEQDIAIFLLDCLSSFLSLTKREPYWAKQTRILIMACECFNLTLDVVDAAGLGLSWLEQHLGIALDFLPNDSLSCHGIKQLLSASATLILGVFRRSPQDFCWTSSSGLERAAKTFQRSLVSTDPDVIETALEVFSQFANGQELLTEWKQWEFIKWLKENCLPRFVWDATRSVHGNVRAAAVSALGRLFCCGHIWELFKDFLPINKSDAIQLMTTVAVVDSDVFVRRSAVNTLCSWVVYDTLEAYSTDEVRFRRTLLRCVASDLDSGVQRAGIRALGWCLEQELNAVESGSRDPDAAKEILKKVDSDGLGVVLGRLLVSDDDREVRTEAFALVGRLRERLTQEFQMEIDETADNSFLVRLNGLHEQADPEEHVSSSTEERSKGVEEVLDKSISDWLQQKLVAEDAVTQLRDNCLIASNGGVSMMEILKHDFKDIITASCKWTCMDSVLEDILSAAAKDHQDQDCY